MIVPMKKVSLIVRTDKKEETLENLRKLGLLHIEITEGFGEKLNALKDRVSLLNSAIFSLGKPKKKVALKTADYSEAMKIAEEIENLTNAKKDYLAKRASISVELERVKGWGDINPETLDLLAQKGFKVSFYEMPENEYKNLGEDVKTLSVSKSKAGVKFMVLDSENLSEETVKALSNYRFELPKESVSKLNKKIEDLNGSIKDTEQKILSYVPYIQSLKAAVNCCEKDIEFEIYSTGMNSESISEEKELSVSYFTGYVEAENVDKLQTAAGENAWGIIIETPTEEDNVPTKLKNNKFVSLIYPLTDFLGTVPGYFEYDISAWFLFFILIFFGIIFGDGGYGLFICAVAALPIIKSLVKKEKVSPTFLLVGLFGLSTILWGTLTCTWFGLSVEQLPAWLKSLSVPVISNVYADKIWTLPWTHEGVGLTTAQNLQIFCFTLALVQLTIAHIKGVCRNIKSLKLLGDFGSILQLLGIYYLVLSLVVNPEVFSFGLIIGSVPIGKISIILIGVGFGLSFIFANYEGNIIKSIITSMTNIVSVLLGVVNVFSDIVSYIRLWAVGLAGAAISATVNELAGPLLGNFMFMILAIILLVFGHGLNMILNILSVIVHGIRLNTLEFSSHLDMSWSGHKFKPFEE
ncbi:MAG: ATPase [Ruminococcaceae bacterium]|nr:ATPase [Oscillospiraceae bacterium]